MSESRHRAIAIILILSLVLTWLVLEQLEGPNPVRDAMSSLLAPIQFALHRAVNPGFRALRQVSTLGNLVAENETLRQENASLREQIVLMNEARIENETLRRQLNYKNSVPTFKLLSAEVIGRDPNNLLRSLILDRGSSDGVRAGMPVLAAEGLVGRIREVSTSSSKAMLITDPSSSISALLQRSRATGVVQGQAGSGLLIRYIPQGDTVEPGDAVLTSGLGGNLPKRLVIGRVASTARSDVDMFLGATVVPAVNLHDLEVVMVLLSFAPAEIAGTPDTPGQPNGE